MRISIHQPNYFPWLGYFYKIYLTDIFVLLDDVQFNNEGLQNYHYIKTPQGRHRLKVPVNYNFGYFINHVKIRYELNWVKKHLKTIEANYRRAEYYNQVFEDYQTLITKEYNNISDLDQAVIEWILKKFDIKTNLVKSSDLNIDSVKENKIIDICKSLNGDVYYSGTGAKAYQNENTFKDSGIELQYSTFNQITYPQLWGNFEPNVSVIDFLMNCGYDWQRVIEGVNQNSNGNR
jgi:hypothetical protein